VTLLTPRELAAALRVGKSTAQRIAARPGFPVPVRLSARLVRYRADEVQQWIERQAKR
jgi:predicted DNA-binding transcriptional regulator AlpA